MNLLYRKRAKIRGQYPLAYYLFAVLVGQKIGIWSFVTLALLAVAILAVWKTASEWAALLAPLSLGFFSAVIHHSASPVSGHLLMNIAETPRYRRPGEVQFTAKVLGRLDSAGELTRASKNVFAEVVPPKVQCRGIDLPWRNIGGLADGSYLLVDALLEPIPELPPVFSYESGLRGQGIVSKCRIIYSTRPLRTADGLLARSRQYVAETIRQVVPDPEQSGLLLSMALGFRDQVSERTEQIFKSTGLAHLLVLSGYQVGLVFVSIAWIISRFVSLIRIFPKWIPISRLTIPIASFVTLLFVLLVGAESSSLRALFAVAACSWAMLQERNYSIWSGIVFSALVILVLNPSAWRDPGVQLTYGALTGIGLGLYGECSKFITFIKVNLCCSAITSVITFFWFGQLYPLGFLLNPVFGPLLGFISCKFGMAALLLHISGVDPSGHALKFVASVLMHSRNMLEQIAVTAGAM